MTDIYLIRHGQTNHNKNDIYMGLLDEPINLAGREQVNKLNLSLDGKKIDEIYTSPLRRCVETAEIISLNNKQPVIIDEALTEIDLGLWQGVTRAEVKNNWPQLVSMIGTDPENLTVPGGERIVDVANRAQSCFKKLSKMDKTIAIVTHEIIIKCIVIDVMNSTLKSYRSFQVDNASLTHIAFDGNYRVVTLNNIKDDF